MIIELDTKKSRDNLIYCTILTVLNFFFCDDWQYWHIIFRYVWISILSGLFQFKYLSVLLKSISILRAMGLIYLFGIICIFKIIFFVHLDIYSIISTHHNNDVSSTTSHIDTNNTSLSSLEGSIILDLLLIDLQCAYMQTLCAAMWMFVKLGKHFGYLNEWKHVCKTIIPHSLTLFFISGCPNMNIKCWWLSLGLYRSFIAITQFILESDGFTSFFDTKDGSIGIRDSALYPQKIASKISNNVEFVLNILSLLRHLYFGILVAPWLMIPLLCMNMYAMCRNLIQQGRKQLQMTIKL